MVMAMAKDVKVRQNLQIALADGNYNSQTTTTSVTTSSLSKWAQSSENICPGWRSNYRKYI